MTEHGNKAHWRSVGVYVFTILVISGALVAYQVHINHHFGRDTQRFQNADRRSCLNRQILIANQTLVLQILHRNTRAFVVVPRIAIPHQVAYFKHTLQLIELAQRRLQTTPPC